MNKLTKAALKEYKWSGLTLIEFQRTLDLKTMNKIDWSVFK